jgi:hypothetical protein
MNALTSDQVVSLLEFKRAPAPTQGGQGHQEATTNHNVTVLR